MASNSWPTPQDYNEAVQSPRACFSDPDLISGTVETNALGLPRAMTGAFASVYRINNKEKSWAVRCFLTSRLDQKDRYKHISDFVLFDDLECTIDFHYVEQGINVKGKWYPCLKMPWVSGDTLDVYLSKNYKTPGKVKQLLEHFHKMVDELECAGIGHGDMQHGNIIVTDAGLRLVDYDALYVPALLGRKSLELGHPNYQHPDRNEDHFDPDVDNFSCWLIHASLLALAIDPVLYDNFNGGDESILFRRTDLANPEESKLFEALLNHQSSSIRDMTSILRRMLWAAPLSIPILDCPPECFDLLPDVRNAQSSSKAVPVLESTATPGDTASRQRNRFDFIDQEATSVQIGAQSKSRKSPSQKFNNLNQARVKLGEDMLLFFSPMTWVHQHMGVALQRFDEGNYDSALNTYLRIYKMMNKYDWANDQSFFWCLMGMGYCSALSDKTALAGNYFLLANKCATTDTTKCRSGLCLAIIRFDGGDESGAMKILFDIWKSNIDLPYAVKLELKNVYIQRASFFHLLRKFGASLLERKDPRAMEVLTAARLLFGELAKTNSIQISEDAAGSMMQLASLYRSSGDQDEARLLYRQIGRAAIKFGVTTAGCSALFCASLLTFGISQKERAGRIVDLDMIVESLSQEKLPSSFGARLRQTIGYSLETAVEAPELILATLIDLCLKFVEKQLQPQALLTAQTAFKITADRQLPLNASLISLIGALGEIDGWTCLSLCYLGEGQDLRPLLNFLNSAKDTKTLKYLAHRLAEERQTAPLTLMLMHFATNFPEDFFELCSDLVVDLKDPSPAKGAIFSALDDVGQRFVANLENLFDLQPSDTHPASKILDSQLEQLNTIAVIRALLKSYGYEVEAQSFSNLIMRMENTQLLVTWMLKLSSEHQSHRFIEFILDPIEYDAASVSAFVLQLALDKTNNSIELFISGLRQWGLKNEKLENILLSAAQLCCERLIGLLNLEPIDPEILVQLRAFYRLKEIAINLGIQKFDNFSKELRGPRYFESLALLMSDLAVTDESKLLQLMTVEMVNFNSESLLKTLTEMAVSQPDKAIIGICKGLLQNGRAPLVVSIATNSAVAKDEEFFKTLSLLIVRELPTSQVLELADELIKNDYNAGFTILIRCAKLLEKTDLLLRLVSKFAPSTGFQTSVQSTGQDEAIGAMVLLSNLEALADLVQVAALSSDRRLSSILCDLDKHELKQEQRQEVVSIVVYRCWALLTEYYERARVAQDPIDNLTMLAILNVAALHRLSALLPHEPENNQALKVLQNKMFSDFVINWLLELAAGGEIEKIATFSVETAMHSNLDLVRTIVLRLARGGYLRALIVSSRKLCAAGFSSLLVLPIQELAQNNLTDAFGSVCLETVTNLSCSHSTLLNIIEGLCHCEKNYLRVILRQIFFYRGKEALEQLYQEWSNSKENSESLVSSIQCAPSDTFLER